MNRAMVILAALFVLALAPEIGAQSVTQPENFPINPATILEDAAEAAPGFEGGLSGALNVLLLLTVLSLVPSMMIMMTCFVRFIIVLGLLKQALGAQGLPPAQVITALALFMTALVMAPTLQRVYDEAIVPYQNGEIVSQTEMWDRAKQPVRDYMFAQIEQAGNWSSVYMIMNYRGIDTSEPETMTRAEVDMLTLIPAYMLSELKIGFTMGFRVYLPFLVIDMVIASMLISMSMMMLPPVLISLPFKILLFVLVDGWNLVVGSLMHSVQAVT
jgi:flagellar biosynthesis protein FliP